MMVRATIFLILAFFLSSSAKNQVLDQKKILDRFDFKSIQKMPGQPIANLNSCSFSPVSTTALRVVVTHQSKKIFTGLYEVEIY